MLKETYKKNIPKIRAEYPSAKFIDVTPTSNSPLSPSPELMSDYRNDKITWDEYTERFKEEMNTPTIEALLLDIAKQAINEDVYLLCYDKAQKAHDCHRFILMDIIEELAKANNIPVKIVKS